MFVNVDPTDIIDFIKALIRPALAIWSASMITWFAIKGQSPAMWQIFLWGGFLAEWLGERAIKRIKEII